MSKDLSNNQRLILEAIKKEIATKGSPPSVRDICHAVGLSSTSSVYENLNKLEAKGYIKREPNKPRAIQITHN
ncbi:winged helix DNA-binding protein [Clostridioides difficile]|nr:winged helix DNA-binding protein [Clostridioides difficile]